MLSAWPTKYIHEKHNLPFMNWLKNILLDKSLKLQHAHKLSSVHWCNMRPATTRLKSPLSFWRSERTHSNVCVSAYNSDSEFFEQCLCDHKITVCKALHWRVDILVTVLILAFQVDGVSPKLRFTLQQLNFIASELICVSVFCGVTLWTQQTSESLSSWDPPWTNNKYYQKV